MMDERFKCKAWNGEITQRKWETFQDVGVDDDLLDKTPKAQAEKSGIHQGVHYQINE